MNKMRLKLQLVRHEGMRLKPYRDSVGKLTIGVGRNLEDVGLSNLEARLLLDNDVERVEQELIRRLTWYQSLSDVRQRVLMDMAFNLGVEGLLKFTRALSAMADKDFAKASEEMLNSKWAQQVGQRAHDLAAMMLTDADPAP